MRKQLLSVVTLGLLLSSCGPAPQPMLTSVPFTSAPSLTDTPLATPTILPLATSLPATHLPTPDPYYTWSNEYLRSRAFGGGQIEFVEVMDQNALFTRYLIRYPSDGLNIYGFADITHDQEIHPVIIALHGYIDPAKYNTLDYTTRYADALASAGYIVLHPNLRGYPPSDSGENLFRVGMAIDVLNLIALVQSQSGRDGPLQNADPNAIGLWGHSMGGGITTRVLTITDKVKAAVLYAAMSGDEEKNYAAIRLWSGGTRGLEEQHVPLEALSGISPMYFFENINAAVSIHHGKADELVPMSWSVTTCERLTLLGKKVECFHYNNMPHTFYGQGDQEFIQNTIDFYNRELK